VKQWRQRRKEAAQGAQKDMIRDAIAPPKDTSLSPYTSWFCSSPEASKSRMIQDEILFKRIDRTTFVETGRGA